MRTDIKRAYFDWICNLIFPNKNDKRHYELLLNALGSTAFIFIIPLDENRMNDGIDLRYRFCYENGLSNEAMEGVLDARGCSVLEMMTALALKCDEHIMFDSDVGGRANVWFFEMLRSLGLDAFINNNFNEGLYFQIIERLLNRQYDPDGNGGLYTIRNPKADLRYVEIWYQMCWYLNDIKS